MFEPLVLRALAAGVGIAVIAGVMGCFVIWRRMAYFSDSLAHSSLLGVALGIVVGIGTNLGVLIVCAAFALLLLWLQRKKILATDTLLGILAHAALSIGLVTISVVGKDIELHDYLFGDILKVTNLELLWILLGGVVILVTISLTWSSMVLMTIHEDLAIAENVKTFLMQILLMFLMTIVVAVSIRVVGVLLIASMLIIPTATARQLVHSPEAMAIVASILGIIAVIGGVVGSIQFNVPSSPAIVVTAAVIFVVLFPIASFILKRRGLS